MWRHLNRAIVILERTLLVAPGEKNVSTIHQQKGSLIALQYVVVQRL